MCQCRFWPLISPPLMTRVHGPWTGASRPLSGGRERDGRETAHLDGRPGRRRMSGSGARDESFDGREGRQEDGGVV